MGTQESTLSHLPLQYHSDIQTQFGKCHIFKLGELYVQKLSILAESNTKLNALIQTLRMFSKQQKNLQKIYSIELDSLLTCMRESRVTIVCDYYSYTLKDVIGRKIGKSRLSQEQIWYILRCIAQAGYFLQKRHLIIGDIRPQNIFISHDHQIKIPVVNIKNNFQNSNYLQSFLCFRQGCLLSPEQFQQLKQGRKSTINHYKSDVYALGMTLLQCCSKLDSSVRFYKYNQFQINYQKVNTAIEELRQVYSPPLSEIIYQMLSTDEHNRPDFRYLCGWLDTKCPYQRGGCLLFSERSSAQTEDSIFIKKREQNGNSKVSLRR